MFLTWQESTPPASLPAQIMVFVISPLYTCPLLHVDLSISWILASCRVSEPDPLGKHNNTIVQLFDWVDLISVQFLKGQYIQK